MPDQVGHERKRLTNDEMLRAWRYQACGVALNISININSWVDFCETNYYLCRKNKPGG